MAPAVAQAVDADLQPAQLARIAGALGRIKAEYLDPVEDQQLVSGCRQGMLQVAPTASIPEKSGPAGLAMSALQEISNTYSVIRQQSTGAAADDKLANACIEGMVHILDDRSAFLDKEEFRELQAGTPGEVGGVGLELGTEGGRLIVVSPIEDAPASRAGLRSGDVIVEIDDTSVAGLALDKAIKRLRGRPGTEVKLTVMRADVQKPATFVVKREAIMVQSVKWVSLSAGVAYIRITQFQEHTGERLAAAISSAYAANQGRLNGLVLDLRNNPGGLLYACVAVSAAFLPKNALVTFTDGRTEDDRMRLYASSEYYVRGGKEDYLKRLPPSLKAASLVVVVNHASAGCSEIVAAALQDHRRATIIGERSFGLGTIQTIRPLGDGTALKLTTARYFRPNSRPVEPAGVTPDLVLDGGSEAGPLPSTAKPEDDPAVMRAVGLLRENPRILKP